MFFQVCAFIKAKAANMYSSYTLIRQANSPMRQVTTMTK